MACNPHTHTNIASTHQPQLSLWPATFSWPATQPSTHKHCVNTPATTFTLASYLLMACNPAIHTQTSCQHTSHNFHFGQVPSHGLQTPTHKHHVNTTPATIFTLSLVRYLLMACNPPTHTHKHHVNTPAATCTLVRYLLMACNPATNEHCTNTIPDTTCTLARYLMACNPPTHQHHVNTTLSRAFILAMLTWSHQTTFLYCCEKKQKRSCQHSSKHWTCKQHSSTKNG